jgi:hypothetical protein
VAWGLSQVAMKMTIASMMDIHASLRSRLGVKFPLEEDDYMN